MIMFLFSLICPLSFERALNLNAWDVVNGEGGVGRGSDQGGYRGEDQGIGEC